ncbi:MAG: RNHCP domain-containing protein [Candidatus Micrarchaeia archaeon]
MAKDNNIGKFTRRKETFKCINCGRIVEGNGYTDHCPYCLFSLHVDINPGDRKETCKGVMKPIKAVDERNNIIIYYQCQKCGVKKRVNVSPQDNIDLVYSLF